ncbi:VITF-3 45kda subunit (Cop-A23R) [Mythimna separata entomopoxvirus 'L']|uniref:VITF-3 45kda subunit (Cop-A23R) n=1 Tax=Mythimna separata entomopoxvirus 'L' TaxID=1293572 RepID=A0A916KQ42_9POXV|nr:VITF-3 45kda subunit (Cop-A23R) [Mythimna separata entomopoxvirus 'L']CCU56312.1 VITF-3 45kda subunit (Cop-A23R) [Mythimna separata entomopoxvirus 'L']
MDDLDSLIYYAYNNNIKRTIVNFRFNIDYFIYEQTFNKFRNDIINNDEYEKTKVNNVSDIIEIRCCYKNKNIVTLSLINPIIYKNTTNNVNKKKYMKLNIIKKNKNTDRLKWYLETCNTSFDSFIKKKKEKKKTLIRLFNNINNIQGISNETNFTQYYETKTEYNNITAESTIKYKIILEVIKEKIVTEGRLLLPNSISITIFNKSRIILYAKNKIQIILSKNKCEDNIDDFRNNYIKILQVFFDLVKEYSNYTIDSDYIKSLEIHCDFNYTDTIFKYPIFFKNNKIRFFGKNKITIKSITSKHKLEEIHKYINNNKHNIIKLYNEIDNCDPVNDPIDKITELINSIYCY